MRSIVQRFRGREERSPQSSVLSKTKRKIQEDGRFLTVCGMISSVSAGCGKLRRAGQIQRGSVRGSGVAGAADLVDTGDAGFDWWKRGWSGVGFGLVPVGDGKEIVGADIGVAVLDGGAQGFRERNGRVEMEAVNGRAAASVFFAFDRSAHRAVRE